MKTHKKSLQKEGDNVCVVGATNIQAKNTNSYTVKKVDHILLRARNLCKRLKNQHIKYCNNNNQYKDIVYDQLVTSVELYNLYINSQSYFKSKKRKYIERLIMGIIMYETKFQIDSTLRQKLMPVSKESFTTINMETIQKKVYELLFMPKEISYEALYSEFLGLEIEFNINNDIPLNFIKPKEFYFSGFDSMLENFNNEILFDNGK